jgi:uncharacterized protein YutE (UPF0331/DUF86 family)
MTYLAERLSEMQRYLDHLRSLAPRVQAPEALEADLSLRNDVLFSLLMVAQMVVDICGELSTRANLRFGDYTEAVANLRKIGGFPPHVVDLLQRLPGFRNVVIHEYVGVDNRLVVAAVHQLEPIEEFVQLVARLEADRADRP